MPRPLTVLLALAVTSAAVCAQQGASAQGAASTGPAAWERRADQSFENRGLAKVERVGQRWALTILCRGQHTVYLDASEIEPQPYRDRYLHARYHYADRIVGNVACVQAPCAPVIERRIVLERVELVAPSEVAVRAAVDRCEPEAPQ